MVDKTPAELDPGTPSDTSIVHASENGVSTNSKGHGERDISRLQGTAPSYSSSKTYNLNDLVTESGIVYINTTAIAIPETFTSSKWVAISEEDITIDVRNISGSLIPKGSAVYITGASGNNVTIDLALASGIATVPAIGIVLDDIANNSNGKVVNVGTITNLDTSSFSVGDTLFVSATSAGDLTATPPTHPNLRQTIAVVLVSNVAIGEIQVITGDLSGAESGTIFNTYAIGDNQAGTKILEFDNGSSQQIRATPTANRVQDLQDLDGTIALVDDITITSAANVGTGVGQVFRDITTKILNLKTLLAGTGITITNNADDITIASTTGAGSPSVLLHNVNTETVTVSPNYIALGGSDAESSIELNAINVFPTPIKTKNMTIGVSANSGGVSTLTMRKNGANGNQVVVIPASTTGIFRDVTNDDDFGVSDVGDYQLISDGDGSLVVQALACEVVAQ